MVEMARRFHGGSIYASLVGFDAGAVLDGLTALIGSPIGVTLVQEKEGSVVVGAIGGLVGPHFVSGGLAASELFWWVEPEHRGSGVRLLFAYEAEAKRRGATVSSMIAPDGSEDVESIYRRRGYRRAEAYYMKEL